MASSIAIMHSWLLCANFCTLAFLSGLDIHSGVTKIRFTLLFKDKTLSSML